MRHFINVSVTFTLILALAGPAWAQGDKGGGKGPPGKGGGKYGPGSGNGGGNREEEKEVAWSSSWDEAVKKAGTEDKHILMYVYNPTETKDPAFFHAPEVLAAAVAGWVFVKREFSKDDKELARLKITAANTLIGLDRYTNDFKQRGAASSDTLQLILKSLPPIVTAFRAKIGTDWAQATKSLEETKEDRAIKEMIEIISTGKRGYKEIVDSLAKIRELGDQRLKSAETTLANDAAAGVKTLKELIELFKGTTAAAAVEIRLARHEREHDGLSSCLARLAKVAKIEDETYKPECDTATKLNQELLADGASRVDSAAKLGSAGEVDRAKELLRKLQKDYKGTSVELKATEALKTL